MPPGGGRRRTDAPDALWRSHPGERLSDHPTAHPGSADRLLDAPPVRRPPAGPDPRAPRRPEGPVLPAGRALPGARAASRSGLPLPPVPAPSRGPAHPSLPVPPLGGALPAGPPPAPVRAERAPRRAAVLTEAPPPPVDDERGPWATGPGVAGLGRPDVRVPAPRSDSGQGQPAAYGDWTKPSRSTGMDQPARPASGPLLVAPAPGTTAIPERRLGAGSDEAFDDGYDDDLDDDLDGDLDGEFRDDRDGEGGYADEFDDPYAARAYRDPRFDAQGYEDDRFADDRYADDRFDSAEMYAAPAAEPLTGPGTGPVGGRAAKRAQRQAADAARRKAAKANRDKATSGRGLAGDGDHPRRPRRVALSLLAMALVALAVLGVYSFATPDTKEAGSQNQATPSAPAQSSSPDSAALAPPPADVPPVEAAPTTPVRVPVTVLNATQINGLAAKISAAVVGAGWESPGVGAYTGDPVAATTVFFTEGDEQQRQAAVQLVDQFPGQITGPAPRFFEVPDVADPGLVVVATGDWQP